MKQTAAAVGLLMLAWLSLSASMAQPTRADPWPAHDTGLLSAPVVQLHDHHHAEGEGIQLIALALSHYDLHRFRIDGIAQPASTRLKKQSYSSGTIYVYRCPVCGKTFRRKTMDPELNPHKTRGGWPCSGTYGMLVGTTF
jgi:hypothetical protein